MKILTAVKEVQQNKDLPIDLSLDEILTTAGVTLDDYTKAVSISKSGESIILKRQPSKQNANCYSPAVLKTWQANMDIQYVINAYEQFHKNVQNFITLMKNMKIFNFKHSEKEIYYRWKI